MQIDRTRPELCEASHRVTSRRAVLSKVGVAVVGSVSGCLSSLAEDPVTVGYRPTFRTLQGPVMVQKGSLDDLDVSVEAKNYAEEPGSPGGGLADGTVEVALTSVQQAIHHHDADDANRIVAANNVNDTAVFAGSEFARSWADHGPDAFEQFREQHGRRFELAAKFPLGRVWLDALGVSSDLVELVDGGGDPEAVTVQFRDGQFDGLMVRQPDSTVLARDSPLESVAWLGSAFSNQPGGVTVMQADLWEDQPDVARAVLEKHASATALLENRPGEATTIVSDALEDGSSTDLVSTALREKTANYLTDPRPIVDETETLVDLLVDYGVYDEPITTEELFEPSLYADIA